MFTNKFLKAALPVLCIALVSNQAEAANVICRGGNVVIYQRAIKDEVAQQLSAQGVDFSAVLVGIRVQDRKASKQTFIPDLSSQLTVTGNPLDVEFTGDLPAATSCTLPASVHLVVYKGNAQLLNKTFDTNINGTLLNIP